MLRAIRIDQLAAVAGGAAAPDDPSVAYCKRAYEQHQITNADIRAFGNDLSYRGRTPQAAACFAKASRGGFGFSRDEVMRQFGINPSQLAR